MAQVRPSSQVPQNSQQQDYYYDPAEGYDYTTQGAGYPPADAQIPQNSQQQDYYYDPTAGYDYTTQGAGYPPADATNAGTDLPPLETNYLEKSADNGEGENDNGPPELEKVHLVDSDEVSSLAEPPDEKKPDEKKPDEKKPDEKKPDETENRQMSQSKRHSSRRNKVRKGTNKSYPYGDYHNSYYNSQRTSGPMNNTQGQGPCKFGVIPMRSAAFQAPRIPLPKLCNHLLQCGGQDGQEEEDGVAFQFKPQTHCRTEVTFTIEPKPQPPWLTMLNCGFKPMVNCSAPPCYLSPNGNPGMDYMGGAQSVVNRTFGSEVQYCGMANFPTLQQIHKCFPGGKIIDASKKDKRGKGSASSSSESSSSSNSSSGSDSHPQHGHHRYSHSQHPAHYHYGQNNNHNQHAHGQHAPQRRHSSSPNSNMHQRKTRLPDEDRKKSTSTAKKSTSTAKKQSMGVNSRKSSAHIDHDHHHHEEHHHPHHPHHPPHHHHHHHHGHDSLSKSEHRGSSVASRSDDWHL